VRSLDLRSWIIEPSGERSLLSEWPTSGVDHGRFTATACDDKQLCSKTAYVEGYGSLPDIPLLDAVVFEPDGPRVAFYDGPGLTIFNVQTSDRLIIDDPAVRAGVALRSVGGQSFSDRFTLPGPNLRFLPNGRGMVVGTSVGMLFVDPQGKTIASARFLATDTATVLGIGSVLHNAT
jgi:hypothetical protein